MRIALTGTHRAGKSTLAQALVQARPGLRAIAEPYYHLLKQGYAFSASLTLKDFTKQLDSSLQLLKDPSDDVVFDRCPLDFLGYLACLPDARAFDFEQYMPVVQKSLGTLDLLVYVPIEQPERIELPITPQEMAARAAVDQAVKTLLGSTVAREWEIDVITVKGTIEERVRQILSVTSPLG